MPALPARGASRGCWRRSWSARSSTWLPPGRPRSPALGLTVHVVRRRAGSVVRAVHARAPRPSRCSCSRAWAWWSTRSPAAGSAPLVADLLPSSHSLPDLLLLALVATVLSNLVNNLPATLLLVPLAAPLGTVAVLATLVGLNVGSSLTWDRVAGQPALAAHPVPGRRARVGTPSSTPSRR